MKKIIFSDSSHVQIQGDSVLRIREVKPQKAVYELVGFEHYPVLIEDTRPTGLAALRNFMLQDQVYEFAPTFNQPSYIVIARMDSKKLVIRLSETQNKNPEFMLWIAIGMEDAPPAYSFVLCENIPYQPHKKALLSLYKRPVVCEVSLFPTVLVRPSDIPGVRNSNCVARAQLIPQDFST